MTYEDYKIGEMYFPPINGADEGNFAFFLIGVACGIFGQNSLKLSFIHNYPKVTLVRIIGGIISFGGFTAVINLYTHTYKKRLFGKL